MLMPSHPWTDILNFYRDLGDWQRPMAGLVEQIAGSQYGELLHGVTSMFTLIVSVTERFTRCDDALHIVFNPRPARFSFEFWEQPYLKNRWRRECPADQGWAVFTRFVKLHRWITVDL